MNRRIARSRKGLQKASDLRVLTPIGEGALIDRLRANGTIRRLIIDRHESGYRVIFFLANSNEPLTVARRRGGIRIWSQLESVVRWLEKNVPEHRDIELYLHPFSSQESE